MASSVESHQLGTVSVHLSELRVSTAAGQQSLTPLEGKLLAHLLAHRGRTVPRDRLLEEVWGYSPRSVTRAVDNAVSRLRRKIERDPARPRWLVSSRGGGYRLEASEPVRGVAGNVPASRDGFVGREADLAELAEGLGRDRLVTLVGPGGTGKTRLALEVARRAGARFPGGAWIVDLTHATSRERVLQAVASELHVSIASGDPATELARALSYRGALLLVLDNCDTAPDAADLVALCLDRAADLVVLATSREPLRLRGELRRPVRPLALPPENREPDGAEVLHSEAVELFVQRAAAGATRFEPGDASALAAVARLLDGLPLALELAAAQIDRITLAELAQGLQHRLDALTSADRDRPDRHRTLSATLDWSWDRLSREERAVLPQLSVFAGGFDLAAAEAVVAADGVERILELLEERSLIQRLGTADGWRYTLLATVRTWAAERVPADHLPGLEARHWRHYASLGDTRFLVRLERPGSDEVQGTLRAELGNLVAACRRAITRGDGPRAVLLGDGAVAILTLDGALGLATELTRDLAALAGLPPRERARAERAAALSLEAAGRVAEAIAHHEAAVDAARDTGDPRYRATALGNLAVAVWRCGELDRARRLAEEGRGWIRADGEGAQLFAWLTGTLGHILADRGDLDEAVAAYTEALELHRSEGNRRHEGNVALHLGVVHARQGQLDEAQRYFLGAIDAARDSGDRRVEALALANLGELAMDRGDLETAGDTLTTALALQRGIGARQTECITLRALARVRAEEGDLDEGVALLESAVAGARETRQELLVGGWLGELGVLHDRADRRIHAERCFAEGEEILRRLTARTELGRLLASRGRALIRWGKRAEAREGLGEAERLARETRSGPQSEVGREIAALAAELERAP